MSSVHCWDMTSLAKGLHQQANPNKYNRTRPHHPLAKMLCERYIYEHALTERMPPAANLPATIITPAVFTAEIVLQIDPPQEHWNRSVEHEQQRRRQRQTHNKVFENIMDNVKTTLDALLFAGGITAEDHAAYLEGHSDTMENYWDDSDTGYIEMPIWMIHLYDLLRQLQKFDLGEGGRKFTAALERFTLVLLYPVEDKSTYNLNLNYRWQIPDTRNMVIYYHVLSGYRIGRSMLHQSTTGDRPAVYLTEHMQITTLLSRPLTSPIDFRREGLISRIDPEKYV